MEVGRGLGGGSPLTTSCWFAPPTLSHAGEACPILCDMVRWVRFAPLAFYRSAAGAGPGRRGLGDAPTLPPSLPPYHPHHQHQNVEGGSGLDMHIAQAESSCFSGFSSRLPLAPVNVQYNSFQIIWAGESLHTNAGNILKTALKTCLSWLSSAKGRKCFGLSTQVLVLLQTQW